MTMAIIGVTTSAVSAGAAVYGATQSGGGGAPKRRLTSFDKALRNDLFRYGQNDMDRAKRGELGQEHLLLAGRERAQTQQAARQADQGVMQASGAGGGINGRLMASALASASVGGQSASGPMLSMSNAIRDQFGQSLEMYKGMVSHKQKANFASHIDKWQGSLQSAQKNMAMASAVGGMAGMVGQFGMMNAVNQAQQPASPFTPASGANQPATVPNYSSPQAGSAPPSLNYQPFGGR